MQQTKNAITVPQIIPGKPIILLSHIFTNKLLTAMINPQTICSFNIFATLKNMIKALAKANIVAQTPNPSKRRNEGFITGPTHNRIIWVPKITRIIDGIPTKKTVRVRDRLKVLSTHGNITPGNGFAIGWPKWPCQ